MAQARTVGGTRPPRRIVVSVPERRRVTGLDGRPALLPPRPAPPPVVTWSVFALEPDGRFTKVLTGLTAAMAIRRAAQWWAAEQDRNGDRDFAAGLTKPDAELAEQEVRETDRWIREGKPRPWDYD